VIPKVGDGLYDNERRKMLTIVEDTTDGVHDTLIAACDKERYLELGGGEEHRHCAGNLVEGLGALGRYYVFFRVLDFSPPAISFLLVCRFRKKWDILLAYPLRVY
jgi:hypothetical protein